LVSTIVEACALANGAFLKTNSDARTGSTFRLGWPETGTNIMPNNTTNITTRLLLFTTEDTEALFLFVLPLCSLW
jgi:hypothetical protein